MERIIRLLRYRMRMYLCFRSALVRRYYARGSRYKNCFFNSRLLLKICQMLPDKEVARRTGTPALQECNRSAIILVAGIR
jgi:hypothetical protein